MHYLTTSKVNKFKKCISIKEKIFKKKHTTEDSLNIRFHDKHCLCKKQANKKHRQPKTTLTMK